MPAARVAPETSAADPTAGVHRMAAFTREPTGGNPAGVWLGARLPDAAAMQRTAAAVGFSETVFLAPTDPPTGCARSTTTSTCCAH